MHVLTITLDDHGANEQARPKCMHCLTFVGAGNCDLRRWSQSTAIYYNDEISDKKKVDDRVRKVIG